VYQKIRNPATAQPGWSWFSLNLTALYCLGVLEHMEPSKRPKRLRDMAQLAKAIVDEATGQVPPESEVVAEPEERHVRAGRLGGKKGGKAHARTTSGDCQESSYKAVGDENLIKPFPITQLPCGVAA